MSEERFFWYEHEGLVLRRYENAGTCFHSYHDSETDRRYVLHMDEVEELNAMQVIARAASGTVSDSF